MAHKIRITMFRDLPTYVEPKHRNTPDVYIVNKDFGTAAEARRMISEFTTAEFVGIGDDVYLPVARISKIEVIEVASSVRDDPAASAIATGLTAAAEAEH